MQLASRERSGKATRQSENALIVVSMATGVEAGGVI